MTETSGSQLVTAAEAARILGVTRGRVVELAAHPDRGPLHPGLQAPPAGERSRQVWKVRNLAAEEATALHHSWIGEDHLVLALLHPDCPGAEGRSIGPVEIPPGCRVKARHERD